MSAVAFTRTLAPLPPSLHRHPGARVTLGGPLPRRPVRGVAVAVEVDDDVRVAQRPHLGRRPVLHEKLEQEGRHAHRRALRLVGGAHVDAEVDKRLDDDADKEMLSALQAEAVRIFDALGPRMR